MSGGVDSSVAAYLLKEEGYDVIGITFSVYDYSRLHRVEGKGSCCSIEDVDDARLVCDHLGIKHYLVDSREAFRKNVIEYFASSYKKGQTPNPCMACNTFIKFDELEYHAKIVDADLFATGHYVRRSEENGRYYFETAVDTKKDQSYFLMGVQQNFIKRCMFPLAGLTKSEIREIAKREKLPVSSKPESMEVCFIPNNDYRSFLKKEFEIENRPGNIVDQDGKILGRHEGIHHFTLGQRRGFGAFGPEASYVIRLDAQTNEVVIGQDPALFSQGVLFTPDHFEELKKYLGESLYVKIRSRSELIPVTLHHLEEEEGVVGIFDQPQRAVTPGQFAVFYQKLPDDHFRLLGGGPILQGWNPFTKISQTGS